MIKIIVIYPHTNCSCPFCHLHPVSIYFLRNNTKMSGKPPERNRGSHMTVPGINSAPWHPPAGRHHRTAPRPLCVVRQSSRSRTARVSVFSDGCPVLFSHNVFILWYFSRRLWKKSIVFRLNGNCRKNWGRKPTELDFNHLTNCLF